MSYTHLLLPALFLAISATATAQDRPQRGDRLKALDTNNDGAISLDEANAPQLERFTSIDTNGDGNLTQAEMDASVERRREERRAGRFAESDTDGNGSISQAEFLANQRGNNLFERLDTNKDEVISAEELAAGRQGRRGQRGRRGPRRDGAPATSTESGSDSKN